MTFVLSVHSRYSVWMVADRRLSFLNGRAVEDAVKIMRLEAVDGGGLLGCAGIGATGAGTRPPEWISTVLRGRRGLTFEQSLSVIVNAANREIPRDISGQCPEI
ncbi:hypothetical protein ACQP00_43400 [Dactylosporangium sp. CS-047395]|uniref:hypothetical protein n=1 Tax=Dactylosporangium sp. CS-047395 TaxID=3239936 RepID=UPI003D90BFB6